MFTIETIIATVYLILQFALRLLAFDPPRAKNWGVGIDSADGERDTTNGYWFKPLVFSFALFVYLQPDDETIKLELYREGEPMGYLLLHVNYIVMHLPDWFVVSGE